jgi:hypothetical protein
MRLHGIGVSLILPSDTDTPQLEYENQFKPPETKALGNISGSIAASDAAKLIVKGIERGQYLIIPALEAKVMYHLSGLLGMGVNHIIDKIIAGARKRKIQPNRKRRRSWIFLISAIALPMLRNLSLQVIIHISSRCKGMKVVKPSFKAGA